MAQETVFIDFQVDYTELDSAQAALAKTGKVDTKSFDKIQNAINETASDTQGLIKQFKEVGNASIKMGKSVENALGAGIQDALDDAGVSVKEFEQALKKANAPVTTLKKELAGLKEALARAKAEGKDTGKEFESLRNRAGQLSDAISDANAEIKNAGSDTKGIDNVVGSISALAGGYAAVQGAAALFGDESEDLQKTLVKVNSAMAIASGIQQVMNALQKEGALIKLKDVIATQAQSAATTIYTFVTNGATVATKVFRAALVATGIGAIVILVISLVSAMVDLVSSTDDAEEAQKKLKESFDRTNRSIEDQISITNRANQAMVNNARAVGLNESEVFKIQQRGAKQQEKLLRDKAENSKLYYRQLVRANIASEEEILEAKKKADEDQAALDDNLNAQQAASFAETKRLYDKAIEDQKKFLDKRKEALKRAADEAARQARQTDANFIKLALDRANKEIEAEFIAFENKSDIDAQEYETKKKNAEDWDKAWKEFQDSLVKSSEDASAKMKADEEKRREELVKTINQITYAAEAASRIFSELSSQQTARDQEIIASERRKVEEQLRAGAITEKAAEARQRQIDQREREAKNRAAQREKKAAVFSAVIAIPKAFLQGLSTGGPILGAVYAALAAVEAALIIARPVPKFFRGKKDSYQGPGIVGDMGSEIVERDGRMYLYTKPTQTYLGAKDKVYTAAETRKKLHNSNLNTTVVKSHPQPLDMVAFAKAIPAASLNVSINKDGITEWVTGSQSRTKYMDKRYRSK